MVSSTIGGTTMAKRSLERDKERFAAWREQKQGGERIPDELWQMASGHIPTLGLNRAAQEFHLDFSRLREKAQQFGVALPKVRRNRSEERRVGKKERCRGER